MQQGGVDAAFEYLDTLESRTYSSPIVAVIDSGGYSSADGVLGDLLWDGVDCDLSTFNLSSDEIAKGCPYGGYDVAEGDNDPRKKNTDSAFSHGDLVSHMAFSERGNNMFSYGTAYRGRLMYLKASGESSLSHSSIIPAIDFAIRNGANVINMSFSRFITCNTRTSNPFLNKPYCDASPSAPLYEIIRKYPDVLFVVSAGNDGKELGPESSPVVGKTTYYTANSIFLKETTLPFLKSSFSGLLSLVEDTYLKVDNLFVSGGVNRSHNIYTESNYGQYVSSLSPGRHIKIPYFSFFENVSKFSSVSGTSFSAPFISGLASTLLSIDSTLKPSEVVDIIVNTSQMNESLSEYSLSGGYVNAFCSVRRAILGNDMNTELLPPYNFSVVVPEADDGSLFYIPQKYLGSNFLLYIDSEVILSAQSDVGTKVVYTFTNVDDSSITRIFEINDGGCEKIIKVSDLPSGSWKVTAHTSLGSSNSEKSDPININIGVNTPPVPSKKIILSNDIVIDNIAEDNIINSLEKSQGVTITGTVADDDVNVEVKWGDNIKNATVSGTTYSVNFSPTEVPDDTPFSDVSVRTSRKSVFSDYVVRVVNIDTSAPLIAKSLYLEKEVDSDGSVIVSGDLIVNELLSEAPSVIVEGNDIGSVGDTDVISFLGGISFGDDGGALIKPTDVAVDGDYMYVIDSILNSLLVFDVSDKSNPLFVSKISDGDEGAVLNFPSAIAISGDYAYIASENFIEIINISNPDLLSHTSTIKDEIFKLEGINKLEVNGNYLFVASVVSSAIEVIDISTPTSPASVKTFSSEGGVGSFFNVYDFEIVGDYLYAVSQSSNTLDIIKISTLEIVGHIINGGTILMDHPNSVAVSGDYAYIVSETSRALQIIDISDPTSPIHSGNIASSGDETFLVDVMDIAVYGNIVFVTTPTGINMFNVTDKTLPTFIKNIETDNVTSSSAGFNKIILDDSTLYAPINSGSIYVLNISNSENISDISVISEGTNIGLGAPINVAVNGNYAYVISSALDALEVIDISDPANLRHVSFISGRQNNQMVKPRHIRIRGNYAYVIAKDSSSLNIIDISDPLNLSFVGRISDPSRFFNLRSLALKGNYAYLVSDIKTIETDLSLSIEVGRSIEIVDISNPLNPSYVKSIQNGFLGLDFLQPTYLEVIENYLYVGARGSGKVQILDITDPLNPVFVGDVSSIILPDGASASNIKTVHEFAIDQNFLYILSNDAFTIVDISNPTSPVTRSILRGRSLTYDGYLVEQIRSAVPQSVYVKDRIAYVVTNFPDRIIAIDVSNPDNPSVVSNVKPSGSNPSLLRPVSIFLDEDSLYVASIGSHTLESFSFKPITYLFEKRFATEESAPSDLEYQNFEITDLAGNTTELRDLSVSVEKSFFNFNRSGNEGSSIIDINDGLIFVLSVGGSRVGPPILSNLVKNGLYQDRVEHINGIQESINAGTNDNYDITKNGFITINDALVFLLSIGGGKVGPSTLAGLVENGEFSQRVELINNLQFLLE